MLRVPLKYYHASLPLSLLTHIVFVSTTFWLCLGKRRKKMMKSEMFSGRKEMMKSKAFAQTCTKFSHFLKQRRSFPEFAFPNIIPSSSSNPLHFTGGKEMSGATSATMNLFGKKMEKEGHDAAKEPVKSLDLFPFKCSSPAISVEEPTPNMADNRELPRAEEEPKIVTSSMTIFYGGRVLVFDDLPEDKAHEIMSLASQGTNSSHAQTPTPTRAPTLTPTFTPAPTPTLTDKAIITGEPTQDQAGSSELPIARRVSLHRFMEKRKHRIAATAPYPLYNASTEDHEKYNLMANFGQQQEKEIELKLFQ